jgi:hypothetical protein
MASEENFNKRDNNNLNVVVDEKEMLDSNRLNGYIGTSLKGGKYHEV